MLKLKAPQSENTYVRTIHVPRNIAKTGLPFSIPQGPRSIFQRLRPPTYRRQIQYYVDRNPLFMRYKFAKDSEEKLIKL